MLTALIVFASFNSHEHKLAFYKLKQLPNDIGVYGRCIGQSGFPSNQAAIPIRANASGVVAFDARQYTIETGFFNQTVTYNGFVHLELLKSEATLTYSSLATDPVTGLLSNTLQTDLIQELFNVDEEGNVVLSQFAILDEAITVINNQ